MHAVLESHTDEIYQHLVAGDEAACRSYVVRCRWPHGFECARCGASISPRYFLVELLTGLVFLASCETAKRSPKDAFRGTAPQLVAAGLPAVIAMQYDITDDISSGK